MKDTHKLRPVKIMSSFNHLLRSELVQCYLRLHELHEGVTLGLIIWINAYASTQVNKP